jgi:biopolymer transport protein ExbB/TolQ
MVAIAVFASVLILAAMGLVVYVIRTMLQELREARRQLELSNLSGSQREQMAYMTAVSQIKDLVVSAFDHLQSKSAVEAAQVAHVRAESQVAVRNLQDELAKARAKAPAERPKIRSRDGTEYHPDEIEIA